MMRKNKRCQKSKSPQVSYKSLCAWECVGVCASVRMCVYSAFQSKSHAGLCVCGNKSSHSWRRNYPCILTLCKRLQVCFCVSHSILLLVCRGVFDWVCVNVWNQRTYIFSSPVITWIVEVHLAFQMFHSENKFRAGSVDTKLHTLNHTHTTH